ncbi:hypothetical protein MRX96_052523 [Rhipicephalus microplus]
MSSSRGDVTEVFQLHRLAPMTSRDAVGDNLGRGRDFVGRCWSTVHERHHLKDKPRMFQRHCCCSAAEADEVLCLLLRGDATEVFQFHRLAPMTSRDAVGDNLGRAGTLSVDVGALCTSGTI